MGHHRLWLLAGCGAASLTAAPALAQTADTRDARNVVLEG
ncbi:MAG: hypothetical protein JWM33_3064, partial [Caulobacteraceae bacterium]|nr:hypothetical protein [Caulobacteraceae bacterium]